MCCPILSVRSCKNRPLPRRASWLYDVPGSCGRRPGLCLESFGSSQALPPIDFHPVKDGHHAPPDAATSFPPPHGCDGTGCRPGADFGQRRCHGPEPAAHPRRRDRGAACRLCAADLQVRRARVQQDHDAHRPRGQLQRLRRRRPLGVHQYGRAHHLGHAQPGDRRHRARDRPHHRRAHGGTAGADRQRPDASADRPDPRYRPVGCRRRRRQSRSGKRRHGRAVWRHRTRPARPALANAPAGIGSRPGRPKIPRGNASVGPGHGRDVREVCAAGVHF